MTTRLTPELLARIRQYPSNRISAAPSALLWAVEALLAELDAVTRERDIATLERDSERERVVSVTRERDEARGEARYASWALENIANARQQP
jgi:hypothetical protein